MHTHSRLTRLVAWIAIFAFGSTNALAAPIDLASSPLVTGIGKTVAPNIFFILDDSGSMNSEFMPDNVETNWNNNKPCAKNFGYNTIYYNPSTIYSPPLNSDGTSFANAAGVGAVSFNNVKINGFSSSSGSLDLGQASPVYTTTGPITLINNAIATSSGFRTLTITRGALPNGHVLAVNDEVTISGVTGSGSPQTLNNIRVTNINITTQVTSILSSTKFTITAAGLTNANSGSSGGGSAIKLTVRYQSASDANFYYYTHATNPSTCDADGTYTRFPPVNQTWATSTATAAQKTNFANWYSFYRSRILMMKSASGRAFNGVTDKYRVGFTTISEKGMGATKFLDIKKFNTTHKGDWYDMLYGSSGNSYTPLRGALSKAGRYYAGKFADTAGAHDPIQYSCQKNFTILTTDGFWNTDVESPSSDATAPGTEAANYGPFRMDNVTRVGDQDGGSAVANPFKDASAAQNTLADVAYYYYNTDLRPTSGALGGLADDGVTRSDTSTNNVPTSSADPANHQHMTTFTLGLGVDGTLANPGAYSSLLSGSTAWPNPMTGSGSVQESRRIDDLWHAAVNGRGITSDGGNLSAKNPDAVVSELSKALQAIQVVLGSSSAAATSTLQPVDGDNTAFIAQFKTVEWSGDLVARVINTLTGAVSLTNTWSAQTLLDAQDPTTGRNIYTYSTAAGDASTRRKSFTAANLATEITTRKYFNSDATNPGGALPQYSGWTALQQAAATPASVINFIRGVRTNEGTGTGITQLFREREHVLGDIVSAAPVFVRKPPFAYTDPGYASFIAGTAITGRGATVYVGANDGMLHAIDGSTGQTNSGKERWAYIPGMLVKDLYKLAASDYSVNHRFYVDGPLTAGDAYSGGTWSTILVGGLGGGGKGYYAMDVTDPTTPKVLWEFGTAIDYTGDTSFDEDMGYSYGNPLLTKRASDGKWVVIFASGYNNSAYNATTNPTGTGDARGRLYVVDAFTGEKLSEIITSTAANEELSGIARITGLVADGLRDNTTQYVYGGDLSGTLWRFDISAGTAVKLGSTSATAGAQPITVQPELATIKIGPTTYTVVYFGTGRYLGTTDLSTGAPSTATAQAMYAVKDTGADIGVFTSAGANLVAQTLNSSVNPRTSTGATVDWASQNGWYVTTPVGERFNVDPGLQLGTLVIASNIPAADYCNPTGSSVLYQLSYKTGTVLKTNTFQAQTVGDSQLLLGSNGGGGGAGGGGSGGKVVILCVLADGSTCTVDQVNPPGGGGAATRVSWREIE